MWGLIVRRTTVIIGLEHSAPSPRPVERRGGLEVQLLKVINGLISLGYIMEPPLEPKRMGFRELWGCQTHGGAGRVACLGRAGELCAPSPILALCIFFQLAELHPL